MPCNILGEITHKWEHQAIKGLTYIYACNIMKKKSGQNKKETTISSFAKLWPGAKFLKT